MLSPTWPFTPIALGVALVLLLALLVFRAVRKDRREYQAFKRFQHTAPRQRMYRRWLIESFVGLGGAAVATLLLAGGFAPRLLAEVRTWPVSRWFGAVVENSAGLVPGLFLGAAIALVGGTVLLVYLARNSLDKDSEEVPTIGDVGALLPRNRVELLYGAALAVNAGVVEELLFRLALPALIYGATGNALAAVFGSIVVFGLLHAYQGAVGIIGTTLIGGLLMTLYLGTGSILVAVIAHALIDLRSFVLIPVMVYRVHRVGPEEPAETSNLP